MPESPSFLPRLVPFTCGHLTLPTSFFLDGERGSITVPVTAYLIDHPDGLTVFDTGLGARHARTDGTPATGNVDLEESGLIDARLAAAGFDPAAVTRVVNSHLHTDHAGGNGLLPNATVVVQATEWRHAVGTDDRAYHSSEFQTGQQVQVVEGEHDLYGDGSVMLVPSPGHTAGHQSAVVRTCGGEAVLAGDACNLQRALDQMRLPDHCDDSDDYLASLEAFARQRDAGAEIFFSHDPDFWSSVVRGVPWHARPTT